MRVDGVFGSPALHPKPKALNTACADKCARAGCVLKSRRKAVLKESQRQPQIQFKQLGSGFFYIHQMSSLSKLKYSDQPMKVAQTEPALKLGQGQVQGPNMGAWEKAIRPKSENLARRLERANKPTGAWRFEPRRRPGGAQGSPEEPTKGQPAKAQKTNNIKK